MNCFLLTLPLMFLIDSVFGSLPAPVNVSMSSTDFNHFLRWDPGPGTPPGTLYRIFQRVSSTTENISQTTDTSLRLQLDNYKSYKLTVQAYYNQTLHSPESSKVKFIPYKQTKISPPKLSLAGCGDCINVNISLNEMVQIIHRPQFKVQWWKRNEPKMPEQNQAPKSNPSFTLRNLEKGVEYCVQVEPQSMANTNYRKSAVSCTFTSIVEPQRVYVILGAVAGTVVFAIGALTSLILCLQYTGFLCKLKATLPRALTAVRNSTLLSGKILTLDQTIPDLISVSSESRNPTVPLPVPKSTSTGEEIEEEEDDEEEEDGDGEKNPYMDRDGGLSSGENSHQDSRDVSANSALASPLRLKEADVEFNPYEGKDRGEKVSVVSETRQTGVQGHGSGQKEEEEEEEEMKEEACHNSSNINLFSVTLAALAVGEEEEEDLLELSDLKPLLLTDSHTHDESRDRTTAAFKGVNESGYEGRAARSSFGCLKDSDGETQEEEEEEDECSGYMGRT
ncbi:interferon lambda receptor 1-like [Scomber scombrus]|uniref:Interferon lambda receptor 1-like n=1 Tax=Scomber scombrus TaxID=13677 RepID=A0AAV1PAW2_SCOSC